MSQSDNSSDTPRRLLYPRTVWQRIAPVFWQNLLPEAFWSIASVFSLTVNIFLIVILILLGRELFALKSVVNDQLLGGLAENFAKMDEAEIATTINVVDEIQVKFDLPVQTKTTVILTQDVPLVANLSIFGMNPQVNITLKKGTNLPIELGIMVPVDTMVPVNLTVPVNIPLNKTELHDPFVGLQDVVKPYQDLLDPLPNSWKDVPLCETIPGCEALLDPENSPSLLDNIFPNE